MKRLEFAATAAALVVFLSGCSAPAAAHAGSLTDPCAFKEKINFTCAISDTGSTKEGTEPCDIGIVFDSMIDDKHIVEQYGENASGHAAAKAVFSADFDADGLGIPNVSTCFVTEKGDDVPAYFCRCDEGRKYDSIMPLGSFASPGTYRTAVLSDDVVTDRIRYLEISYTDPEGKDREVWFTVPEA